MLQQSPYVYHNLLKGKGIIDNVYNKFLSNYAEIIMSYFSESADRVRGRSGQDMYLDEVQAKLWDAMHTAELSVKSGRRSPSQALDALMGDLTLLFTPAQRRSPR